MAKVLLLLAAVLSGTILAVSEDVFFSANAKVEVTNGYYNATIYYFYNKTHQYLRYEYTNPTKMTDLIDYAEGTRYKVCSKCESGFYTYPAPTLFKQDSDVATGNVDGECKEYIPADTTGMFSIWYKGNGEVCKAELADGKTLVLSNVSTKTKDMNKFNLVGNECPAPVCKRVMDLVFVIDKSGSICGGNSGQYLPGWYCDLGNWFQIQDFVVDIVNSFDIGADATMIGIVTFSDGATKISDLSANKNNIITAMRNAQLTPWITCTGCGIDMGMDILKGTSTARSALDPEKVMIVMTDGINNFYYNNPCAIYKVKCSTYGQNCIRHSCPTGYKTKESGLCAEYKNNTANCLRRKCTTCKNNAWGVCKKQYCMQVNKSNCIKYSKTCVTAYPSISNYCTVSNGEVVTKDPSYTYCMCGTYACEEYACDKYTCVDQECNDCTAWSNECVEYEQVCAKKAMVQYCESNETCDEYECLKGEAVCDKRITNYYAMITGAINRTRTPWALYPASKRLPIVMVIGVTSSINMNELHAIASTLEGKSLVYTVANFDQLSTIISDLVDETCTKQTDNLELCDDKCLGFCGCDKKCYCPTCDTPTGSCYTIDCTTDNKTNPKDYGKTSNGCVAKHNTCPNNDKCKVLTPNNSTNVCCVETTVNCSLPNNKCFIGYCSETSGCYTIPTVPVPINSCYNATTCDNETGWNFISACPEINKCTINECKSAGDEFTCTPRKKCDSHDNCIIDSCDETTGVCSAKPKDCETNKTSKCNIAYCDNGECFEVPNNALKRECAEMVNSSDPCQKYACNPLTGECSPSTRLSDGNCSACAKLNCSNYGNSSCDVYECAINETGGVFCNLTSTCKPTGSGCTIHLCNETIGECYFHEIVCDSSDCTNTRCETVTAEDGTLGHRCVAIKTPCEANNTACFNYTCNPDWNSTDPKSQRCLEVQIACLEPPACMESSTCTDVNGAAQCNYKNKTCAGTNMCFIASCSVDEGDCVLLENSSNCPLKPCQILTGCDNLTGCVYDDISCDDDNPCTIDECVEFDKYSEDDDSASDEVFSSSNDKTLPYVCVHKPKCTTPNFCETANCDSDGNCSIVDYTCKTESETNPTDTCHEYKCDEESRSCKVILSASAFLDVCGSCIKTYGEGASTNFSYSKTACIGGMKATDFAAAIAGSTIAAIVIVCIIAAVAIGVASTLGTKELIKRAKKNADVGTNSNPLYEGNDNEASNPAFTGEN